MTGKTTDRPTWNDVKRAISDIDYKEQVKLIRDLYRLSNTNKDFMHARFEIGDDPLSPYRDIIEDSLYPDVMYDKPIRISRAKRAVSEYSKAVGDALGEVELMVLFVECGNRFTVDFGDIDEDFYDSLLRMYARAINKILRLPKERQAEFRDRLREIVDSSSGIGWGYHDGLYDLYYRAFPDDG